MAQKFHADHRTRFVHPNGAEAFGPGGPFDCLGTWAKVRRCPVYLGDTDTGHRLTCYATGYADTAFSVPACTRYKGQHIGGYFTLDESKGGALFRVLDRYADKLRALSLGEAPPAVLTLAEHRARLEAGKGQA